MTLVPIQRQKNLNTVTQRGASVLFGFDGAGRAAVLDAATAETVADGVSTDHFVTPAAMADVTERAGSALQPTTGVVRLPTMEYAAIADGLDDVDRVYVAARRAHFHRVDDEPTHGVKYYNGGWWQLDELTVTPFMAGAIGNNVADDTAAAAAIVQFAKLSGATVYWPDADFVRTSNIQDFWAVKHTGPGRIRCGSDVWRITPKGDERNIIYVGAPNLTANDGLGRDEPTNISTALNRIRTLGDKAQDGRWQILIMGTITSTGVTLGNLPVMRNRLEIWGEAADLNSVPTSVWDGTASLAVYAIRGDWSYNLSNAYLHFRNIKFVNWNKTANAGGICIWASGDVLSENVHTDYCSIGEWYRQCYVRCVYGRAENAQTYGVCVSYGCSGNVGNLSGGGKTFVDCEIGVSVGRHTTCYIQGCDLSGADLISVTRNSRIRTQSNIFRHWTHAVVYAQANGVWTPDNDQGYPDTYLMTPTDDAPVFRCESGSVHTLIHRMDGGVNAANTNGSLATIANTAMVLLSDPAATGCAAGDFVPARLPSWWAYSPSATLKVRMFANISANAGGTLYLHGSGSTSTAKLAEITIPVNAGGRSGWIEITVYRRKGSSAGRFAAKFESTAGTVYANGNTANLNVSSIRAAADAVLAYRLYWQSLTTDQVVFADMKSYIEA